MKKFLALVLAGCMAGLSKAPVMAVPTDTLSEPDEDVDWDFLGE